MAKVDSLPFKVGQIYYRIPAHWIIYVTRSHLCDICTTEKPVFLGILTPQIWHGKQGVKFLWELSFE